MPLKMQKWTKEQLNKMNEEAFLVEILDMIKISPEISDNDEVIDSIKSKLEFVESQIIARLEAKR